MTAKLKALQQWCKIRCDGYRDVQITNLTSSWKSGLAFCAIIHRYRPDLIDYDSLSKENIFENNQLAFDVASQQLDIPALLDAEDMVAMSVPDKLCIVTYVAQYHMYFRDKEPLGGPGVKARVASKRPKPSSTPSSPPVTAKRLNTEAQDKQASLPVRTPSAEGSTRSTFTDHCQLCGERVYVLERHVDGTQLYHRRCFRSAERDSSVPSSLHRRDQNGGEGPRKEAEISGVSAGQTRAANRNNSGVSPSEKVPTRSLANKWVSKNALSPTPPGVAANGRKSEEEVSVPSSFVSSYVSTAKSPTNVALKTSNGPAQVSNSRAVLSNLSPKTASPRATECSAVSPHGTSAVSMQLHKAAVVHETPVPMKAVSSQPQTDVVAGLLQNLSKLRRVDGKRALSHSPNSPPPHPSPTKPLSPSAISPKIVSPPSAENSPRHVPVISPTSPSVMSVSPPTSLSTVSQPVSPRETNVSNSAARRSTASDQKTSYPAAESPTAMSSVVPKSILKSRLAPTVIGAQHSSNQQQTTSDVLSPKSALKTSPALNSNNSSTKSTPKPSVSPQATTHQPIAQWSFGKAKKQQKVDLSKQSATSVARKVPETVPTVLSAAHKGHAGPASGTSTYYGTQEPTVDTQQKQKQPREIATAAGLSAAHKGRAGPASGTSTYYGTQEPTVDTQQKQNQPREIATAAGLSSTLRTKSTVKTNPPAEIVKNQVASKDVLRGVAASRPTSPPSVVPVNGGGALEWQVEAKRREKLRAGGYNDPERGEDRQGKYFGQQPTVGSTQEPVKGPAVFVKAANHQEITKDVMKAEDMMTEWQKEVQRRQRKSEENGASSPPSQTISHGIVKPTSSKTISSAVVKPTSPRVVPPRSPLDQTISPKVVSPHSSPSETPSPRVPPHSAPTPSPSPRAAPPRVPTSVPATVTPPQPIAPPRKRTITASSRFSFNAHDFVSALDGRPPTIPTIPTPQSTANFTLKPDRPAMPPQYDWAATMPYSSPNGDGFGSQTQKRRVNAEERLSTMQISTVLYHLDLQLCDLEEYGRELEGKIRSQSDETTDSSDDNMVQWFGLVNQKNELVRKEADLMYRKKQQELEDIHEDLEFELRCLMEKADHLKTSSERIRERSLLNELLDTVSQRNSIVDSIEDDRIRYIEEDQEIADVLAVKTSKKSKKKNKKREKKAKKKSLGIKT